MKISRIFIRQVFLYMAVGCFNVLIDFLIYLSLTREIFYFTEHLSVAKTVSLFAATFFSFFTNRRFTFEQKSDGITVEMIKFFLSIGSGAFLNVGVHAIAINYFHLYDILALFVASGAGFIWNFSFAKFWVFKK